MSQLRWGLALLAAGAAFAQAPAFEVATIKTATPPDRGQIMATGTAHVGMKIDAARVDIGFMSLADLICNAYEVKPYQVSGPDWLKTERFDILAKMPDGATKEQVPAMLQALLADRFKLTIHKENQEHPIYALIVGKGGPKLKDAPPDPEAAPDGAPPGRGGMTIATTGNGAVRVTPNGDGRGMVMTSSQMGTTRMSMGADGNMHMESSKMSMAQFAGMLTPMVDRPVLDETGLKGNYQVALDLSMADLMRAARTAGVMAPPPPGAMGGLPGGAAGDASDPGGGGSVFTAVQQLGLKLDPRKEPVETIVIDHMEKAPTEN